MARSLTRWDPFPDFPRLFSRELAPWLGEAGTIAAEWKPRSDITETDDEIVVRAELPGVNQNDIEVEVADSTLHLHGEKRAESEEHENGRTRSERFFGTFERSYRVPEAVDIDKIEARLDDGGLEIHIPKAAQVEPSPKRITIN